MKTPVAPDLKVNATAEESARYYAEKRAYEKALNRFYALKYLPVMGIYLIGILGLIALISMASSNPAAAPKITPCAAALILIVRVAGAIAEKGLRK